MPAVSHVLVAGAGLAGTATATGLAAAGVAVDLIDVKPEITAIGSGITMQGNGLRELRRLGVLDAVLAAGYPFDSLGLRAPDPAGTLLAEIPDARTGGPDLPATVGLPRPALARIMADRAVAAGARLRLGTTVSSLSQDGSGVDVLFSDGSAGRYDLVVGADGIRSATRRMIGISNEPRPTGMGIFRAFGPRPASVTRTDLYYGGPCYIAGYCPTGENSLYAYVVEDARDRSALDPGGRLAAMRALAEAYHGPWDEIRATLTDPGTVSYTLFEALVVPGAVEPGTGRTDRGRRARLPADPGPGRRRRPWRTRPCSPSCCFPLPRWTMRCGRHSPPGGSSGRRPSSRRPASSASGSSTMNRVTCRA